MSAIAPPQHLLRQQCFIGGEWRDALSGETIDVLNPASGDVIGTIPKMGAPETKEAISAAKAAQPGWAALTAKERATILRRWHDLMHEHQDHLALLMTLEQGKSLAEAKGEIAYSASFLEWFGEEAKRAYGDIIPTHQPGSRIMVLKQPVGVVGAITPWNFPSAMIGRKAGPALAAGCTMVVKPATATPYSALAMAELGMQAGLPRGVFNVITGSASAIGDELTSSPDVAKISFTGSTEIGVSLLEKCAGTVKKVSMELGGNAPFIVFDDADIDAAVEGAMASKFRNSGQTCVCANRFYVQAAIYGEFVEKFAAAIAALKVGRGTEPGVTQGPLIDGGAIAKVEEHIADAVSKGGRVEVGGKAHALGGSFFEPTLISNAGQGMLVAHEETFGPLAAVVPFETEEQVIEFGNDTQFGLAAYFYAQEMGRVWRVAEALEAGIVGVNTGLISTEVAPFGGVKMSGLGREGSKYGLDDYLELKYVCLAGI